MLWVDPFHPVCRVGDGQKPTSPNLLRLIQFGGWQLGSRGNDFPKPSISQRLPTNPKLNSHHFMQTVKRQSMKLGLAALASGMCVAAFGQNPTIEAITLSGANLALSASSGQDRRDVLCAEQHERSSAVEPVGAGCD